MLSQLFGKFIIPLLSFLIINKKEAEIKNDLLPFIVHIGNYAKSNSLNEFLKYMVEGLKKSMKHAGEEIKELINETIKDIER